MTRWEEDKIYRAVNALESIAKSLDIISQYYLGLQNLVECKKEEEKEKN